jgi:hypothetical protein
MPGIVTEFLFTIALEVPVLALGETPHGTQRIARIAGGSFDGPKLRGKVLPGGGGRGLRHTSRPAQRTILGSIAFARLLPARAPEIAEVLMSIKFYSQP